MIGQDPKPRTGLGFAGRLGAFGVAALFAIGFGWSYLTTIQGAVIAPGSVVVLGKPKSVQHLDGGVVEEIRVADGEKVSAGDLIVRLDPTLLRANLEIYRNRLAEALARRARLEAEVSGREEIEPVEQSPLLKGVDLAARETAQRELFVTRRAVQEGRRAQLDEKIVQFGNQITGVEGLIASKRAQLDLTSQELEKIGTLAEKGLALDSQIISLRRTEADLLGQLAEHQSELARINNSIRDTELEILKGENEFREKAVTELAEATNSAEELTQQILSTEKQLERVEVRAPVDGVIHELQVVTVGGVVAPGATIVQIVPTNEGMEFETRVDPTSIDQVFVGQTARLRLSALNQRTTPEIYGAVKWMSPTSVVDEATGQSFFRVQVAAPGEELARLGEIELVPGMPAEAYLQTGERTVLSYLIRPMTDHIMAAFREE